MDEISEKLESSLQYYESLYGPRETWSAGSDQKLMVGAANSSLGGSIASTVGMGMLNGLLGEVGAPRAWTNFWA